MRGDVRRSASVKWITKGGTTGQELESALNIAANVANADKPSQGVTRSCGNLPSEFEGDRKLFICYQPRESMGPANGVYEGCKVWSDICVEGRVVFVRVGVIILAVVRSGGAGEIIGALGMNKVDLVKVGI